VSAEGLSAESLQRKWQQTRGVHLDCLRLALDEGIVGPIGVSRETTGEFEWEPLAAEYVEAPLARDLFDELECYARRVLEANQQINLVSRRDPTAQVAMNILDSLPLALAWDLVSRETEVGTPKAVADHDEVSVSRGTGAGGTPGGAEGQDAVSRGTRERDAGRLMPGNSIPDHGSRQRLVSRGTRRSAEGGAVAGIRGGRAVPFLLDAGSGSGVPGVPFHLLRRHLRIPAPPVVMVESRGRKANFLRDLAREMELPACHVFAGRLEDPALAGVLDGAGLEGPGIMAAKALGGTARALGWLRGLAGRIDRAVFIKGPGLATEWRREHARWIRAGWAPATTLAFHFPERDQYLLRLQRRVAAAE